MRLESEDAHKMFGDPINWNEIQQPKDIVSDLMDIYETASFLGICTKSLDNWVKAGSIPDGIVLNKRNKMWSRTALSAFLWGKVQDKHNEHAAQKNRV
jgi:hypothetical protein